MRDAEAAKRLFRKALSNSSHPQPRVINTDLAPIYGSAIPDIKKEGTLRRRCGHRPVQYLNNILEQDHRAIKRRVNAKQGFREFLAAQRTIQGYEAIKDRGTSMSLVPVLSAIQSCNTSVRPYQVTRRGSSPCLPALLFLTFLFA